MKRRAIILIAFAALGAPACGGKKDEPKPAPAGSAAAATGSAAPAAGSAAPAAGSAEPAAGSAAAPAAEVDVPTEVDFETEAAAKINEKNVEAELKAIEQDLAR